MSVGAIGALGVAWFLGVLIVAAGWPRRRCWRADWPLVLPFGFFAGMGVTSFIHLGATLLAARPAFLGGTVEIVAIASLAWVVLRKPADAGSAGGLRLPRTWPELALASVLVQGLVAAAVIGWRTFRAEPFGGWDGWAIWNLHARFLVRAGPAWPALLAEPQLSWTHPDYPRLLAAGVARVWSWAGAESPAASALVSGAFALALLGLLAALLGRLHGFLAASAGALLLLGTPFFVTFAANQHADLPFAGYLLAALGGVLLHEKEPAARGWLALAGLFAGLAAWTKNEGLLFAVVGTAAVAGHGWHRAWGRRAAVEFVVSLGLALLPVVGFKLALAPPGDLGAGSWGTRLLQMGEWARHWTILASLGRDLWQFGDWFVHPLFAMALLPVVWRGRPATPGAAGPVPLVLGGMLAGYYLVYLTSPHDLAWHLDSSLVRLLLQLWPLAILWWSLALPRGADSPGAEPAGKLLRRGTCVAAGNVLVSAALLYAFAGQPAVGELANRRAGLAVISLSLGDGWFAPERYGNQRWAWSRGDATVRLHSGSGRRTTSTLRFSLRAIGPRRMSVRLADHLLWEGAVAEGFVVVTLPDLELPPGTTELRLSSDTPGRPESAAAGARVLSFALYDPELR